MPTVRFRFPGGRYHATPWGHHVNEGLVEWPPSPWRLLRALIACGYSSQGWDAIPDEGQRLLNKLASVLPSYRLPPASAAHSRHFMPIGTLSKAREQTTLVFDTWANVGKGELFIHWPCQLEADETELLRRLCAAIGYLGRSESWVEAELSEGPDQEVDQWNAVPFKQGEGKRDNYEQISLMAAVSPDEYGRWREEATRPALDALQPPSTGRKPTKTQLEKIQTQRDAAVAPFPSDLVACLTKDTVWWKGFGWSQPPGSRRVLYWRPTNCLEVGVPPPRRPGNARRVSTMLLALTSESGRRSSLPPCTRTLPQAELFHRAVVGWVGKGERVNCPELTGKDCKGEALRLNHQHAYTIPLDLDNDGRIDHIVIHAKMGLGADAQRAIRSLRKTWTKGGAGDIQVAVAGVGEASLLRSLPGKLGLSARRFLAPAGGSREWISVTPFVLPRCLKRKGRNDLKGQVDAELASRGLPPTLSVSIDTDRTRDLRHYVQRRQHGGAAPPFHMGLALRLVFENPVEGPLLLGYASHYGLGMFHSIE